MLMVLVIAYKFLFDEFVVGEILTFTAGLGGLFVARKAFSYFKSDAYYENNKGYQRTPNEPMDTGEYGEPVDDTNSNVG
jgi:hypothetical protein